MTTINVMNMMMTIEKSDAKRSDSIIRSSNLMDARIRRSQRFPLGTRVKKYFNGYKDPFEGSVDQHSDRTNLYHITYDDEDSEEMTEDDVEAHLLSLPPPLAQKPLKTVNCTYSPQASTSQDDEKAFSETSRPMSTSVIEPPSPSSSDGKTKPNVLTLNANAPGLMCTIFHEEIGKSSTVSSHTKEVEEVEESEEEEEEVEMSDENDEGDESLSEATPEEINQLIGLPVETTVTREGFGIDVVQGAVASYFPATKMFRVMYFNGECSDLTYQQVFNSIPADLRPVELRESRKRGVDEISQTGEKSKPPRPPLSSKRIKALDLNATSFAPKQTKQSPKAGSLSSESRSPSSPVVRESDMVAIDNVEFDIVRKVLYIIVSTVDNTVMDAQLEALSSADLTDKEALKVFVEKDGLTSLSALLLKWKDQVETEKGVLLILKVTITYHSWIYVCINTDCLRDVYKALAVLPGVTKNGIIDSGIGKKVRGIEKSGSYKDSAISGLASWVIKKLKADVGVQDGNHGTNSSVTYKAQIDRENRSQKSDSPRQGSFSECRSELVKPISPRPLGASLSKENISTKSNGTVKRSNSASHLQNLMSTSFSIFVMKCHSFIVESRFASNLESRNGRDTCTIRHDRDIFGNIVVSQKKSRLGNSNNWRARRSTVVLDQVCKRLTENAQEVEVVKVPKFEDNDWKPSKISFASDDSVCTFDKEVAVSKLLVYRSSCLTKPPNRPPVKPHVGPLRSILRVKPPQEIVPQSSVQNAELNLRAVHSAEKPAIDPIVIPAQPSFLRGDIADESSMFDTSKLCKVVSPTEKRKQVLSPPPCIPVSEQPPLAFSDGAEGDRIETFSPPLHKPKKAAPAEAAKPVAILSQSHVVSESR
ncbi:hypothetical protein PsorP6_013746 [Peronosclerospora sorghi]|uniref:Uncharacterized protein n=1 Tax=Peronosclerospora sorghi TaxID=230839 RepID=A0ACC0VGG6_9STRA|nr:hypothetical protein PsorP6_013746 [Peronosclerospora sorghi]